MTVENRPPMPGITPPGRVGSDRNAIRSDPPATAGLEAAREQAAGRHRAGLEDRRADAHERAAPDGAGREREAVHPPPLGAAGEALDDPRADQRLDRHAPRPARQAIADAQ